MITDPDGFGERVGGWLRLIFFEWTTGYGLYPDRALLILLVTIGAMTLVYMVPVDAASRDKPLGLPNPDEQVPSGTYEIWSGDRIVSQGNEIKLADRGRVQHHTASGVAVLGQAFYFSLLSSFHIGWRDLDVGSWIARIQRREYTLRARGWMRVVSGTQSLASVYLLAIWVLTYFGRPFQ